MTDIRRHRGKEREMKEVESKGEETKRYIDTQTDRQAGRQTDR